MIAVRQKAYLYEFLMRTYVSKEHEFVTAVALTRCHVTSGIRTDDIDDLAIRLIASTSAETNVFADSTQESRLTGLSTTATAEGQQPS